MSSKPNHPEPLEAANSLFHDAYCGARDDVRDEVPILVLLARDLVLHRNGQRRPYPYSRPFFDAAKAAAHVAVALFALARAAQLDAQRRARVESLREHVAHSLDGLKARPMSETDAELLPVLEAALSFADCLLSGGANDAALAAFAQETGPAILRITEIATREQIASLHEAVQSALRELPASELRALQVVVIGDHQARSLSLGMQYFQRRLREKDGSDEQVTYGENITTEEEALQLVATRRLDQSIARAFFGDEKRLQRDVLGDAATKCLDGMALPAIVERASERPKPKDSP